MIVETVKIQIPKEDSGDLVLIDKSTLSKQIYLNTHYVAHKTAGGMLFIRLDISSSFTV